MVNGIKGGFIILWVEVIVLNFCFEEFRSGLHAESIVMVAFLHVLGSIDFKFVSAPDAFEQTLGLFCHYYSFIYPPQMYITLACLV